MAQGTLSNGKAWAVVVGEGERQVQKCVGPNVVIWSDRDVVFVGSFIVLEVLDVSGGIAGDAERGRFVGNRHFRMIRRSIGQHIAQGNRVVIAAEDDVDRSAL